MDGIVPNCELVRETVENPHMKRTQRKEVRFKIPGYLQVETGYRKIWSLSYWDGIKFHHIEFVDGEEKRGISRKVSIPLLQGFQGALDEINQVNSFDSSDDYGTVTLLGFSKQELDSPVSIVAWRQFRGRDETYCYRIKSLEDYLQALAENSLVSLPEGGKIHPVSGNRLIELPREDRSSWAAHYVVVSPKGDIITEDTGEGDFCPEAIQGKKDWRFTCDFEKSYPGYFDTTLADEATEIGLSAQWQEVLKFLRQGYGTNRNPLNFMRRDHHGKWEFIPQNRYPIAKVGDIIFPEYDKNPKDGWRVLFRPTPEASPEDMIITPPAFNHFQLALDAVEEKLLAAG